MFLLYHFQDTICQILKQLISKVLFPKNSISGTNSQPQFTSGLSGTGTRGHTWVMTSEKVKRKGEDATAGLPDPTNLHGRSMYPCANTPPATVKTRPPWFKSLQV